MYIAEFEWISVVRFLASFEWFNPDFRDNQTDCLENSKVWFFHLILSFQTIERNPKWMISINQMNQLNETKRWNETVKLRSKLRCPANKRTSLELEIVGSAIITYKKSKMIPFGCFWRAEERKYRTIYSGNVQLQTRILHIPVIPASGHVRAIPIHM